MKQLLAAATRFVTLERYRHKVVLDIPFHFPVTPKITHTQNGIRLEMSLAFENQPVMIDAVAFNQRRLQEVSQQSSQTAQSCRLNIP